MDRRGKGLDRRLLRGFGCRRSFQFEGTEPGEYSLSGERSGYLRTEYESKSGYGGGTKLTLTAGQHLTKLTLALIPQGVISGRVVDPDGTQ